MLRLVHQTKYEGDYCWRAHSIACCMYEYEYTSRGTSRRGVPRQQSLNITHLWGRGRCSRWWRQRRCDQSEVVRPIRHPSLALSQACSLRLLLVLVLVYEPSGSLVSYGENETKHLLLALRRECAVCSPLYSQPSASFLAESGIEGVTLYGRDHPCCYSCFSC